MKTDLPAPEEYHRLTRARELRKCAARLERTAQHLKVAMALMVLPALVPVVIGAILGVGPRVVLWLVLAAFSVTLALIRLFGSITGKWRAQADRLEAEHQDRYGALGAGEES
jgi:uncharacterized membrane protein